MSSQIDRLIKQSEDNSLNRTLGPVNITLLGIGAVIGAGIFVLTGTAAANYAGPGIVISFIISGIACGFAALCYAEFASMLPVAGSAYTYAYATMGKTVAWIIGWDLILEYLFSASAVAVGWSGYMISFLNDFGIHIPKAFCSAPFIQSADGIVRSGAFFDIPAMLIVGLLTAILYVGIKESTRFNNLIVYVKVGVVLLFVFVGYKYINLANWTPFIPENTGKFGEFGWSGILRGAGVIFFAYIGFDAVSTVAQEAKNPKRDMPIGIILSLAICTILYIAVALVLTGIIDYRLLNVADPIAVGINSIGSQLMWLRPIIKIGALAGLSSVILVMLLGQPRIFYSMSKDGFLPPVFSKIHPRFKTPHINTIITGVATLIIAGLLPIGILGELVSIGTLLAFAIVCGGILVMRHTHPELPRGFRTPWVPFVPIMGVLTSLAQMVALPFDTWMRLVIWMAIGMVIYYFYSLPNLKKMQVE
ncbi:MAG TPA: amino acid permease [Marinilabiliales bacterium]|nr:MAG: amino acid permease [Bacteroidetes bacterium GWC2_40_13]OFX75496.1 MAG: amino acid permease [Bacteroidetes bacterium GWD2_40_43]OFX94011.1 MAG: amino acid permease [Bacteroidetes bacterium GWE2_40_63]OFY19798.1 MAG: amino acid permease [Bacteroidetes bacterium GWF2_40_13]OFZ28211.1 MAG: amino acid permease [Bacteroidetes bacterium RIFOXYC2_FULL_40_12]HAN00058.1 amino acid permease [Marinilabiliales bacterium]